jgi:hypothetical protein
MQGETSRDAALQVCMDISPEIKRSGGLLIPWLTTAESMSWVYYYICPMGRDKLKCGKVLPLQ